MAARNQKGKKRRTGRVGVLLTLAGLVFSASGNLLGDSGNLIGLGIADKNAVTYPEVSSIPIPPVRTEVPLPGPDVVALQTAEEDSRRDTLSDAPESTEPKKGTAEKKHLSGGSALDAYHAALSSPPVPETALEAAPETKPETKPALDKPYVPSLLSPSLDALYSTDDDAAKSDNAVKSDNNTESDSEAESENAAESDDLTGLKKSMESLQSDIDQLKKELKKKQNTPDPNGKFTCKLGGMLFMDALTVDQEPKHKALYGNVPNEFMVRELRLTAKGEGYGFLDYEVTLGYNSGISFKDIFLNAKGLPLTGDTKIGYFKVESNMGEVASIFDQTFPEFDSVTKSFRTGRRLGVGSTHYAQDKRARLFLGAFAGGDLDVAHDQATDEEDNSGIILNTRATAVPIYCESADGALLEVFHIGASYYWYNPDENPRLRSRPTGWTDGMPQLLNGTLQNADDLSVAEFELAWQKRQFAVQTESFFGFYDHYDNAYGVNVQGRWLLNPSAYKKYNKNRGVFAEVFVPENLRFVDYENCTCLAGPGVWEVAGQWSWTDMDNLEAAAPGTSLCYGRVSEFATALNWYWNSQTRISFEWIHSECDSARNNLARIESECDTFMAQARIRF